MQENDSQEFYMLKSCLQDVGIYEYGLDVEEMRKIYKAINKSLEESEYEAKRFSFEREINEAEFSTSSKICNSTMLIDASESEINTNIVESGFQSTENMSTISPISSPELPPKTFIVLAEVHNAFDYSPKRISSSEDSSIYDKKVTPSRNNNQSSPLKLLEYKSSSEKVYFPKQQRNKNNNDVKDSGMEISVIKCIDEN